MSLRARLVSSVLRRTLKRQMASFDDHRAMRSRAGASMGRTPREVAIETLDAGGVPAERVRWAGAGGDRVMLYLHGGGYVFGSPDSHRGLAWRLARTCGCDVLMADYRLAPEHPFPAAVDDAFAAYQWLLAQGNDPQHIIVAGDSAGGGLAVALMVKLKEEGVPLPAAAALLSPWTDLTLSGASVQTYAHADAMLSPESLRKFRDLYLGDADPASPLASPLFADLSALPPVYIAVGSTEVLRDDSQRLADALREAGGEVELELWPDMPHVFPLLSSLIPEGQQAIDHIAAFLHRHRAAATASAA